jgi:hypothetical protein
LTIWECTLLLIVNMPNQTRELDSPARFSTGVGIERPMLSNIFRNAASSSPVAGCELLGPMVVEFLDGEMIIICGVFQLGTSRISLGSIKLGETVL